MWVSLIVLCNIIIIYNMAHDYIHKSCPVCSDSFLHCYILDMGMAWEYEPLWKYIFPMICYTDARLAGNPKGNPKGYRWELR